MSIQELRIERIEPSLVFEEHLDPWEKQDTEDDRAWFAFMVYRDLSPSRRSLVACARVLKGRDDLRLTPDWLKIVSKTNNWTERVAAYDRWRDTNMRQQLEERILERRLAAANLAQNILDKVAEAVAAIQSVIEVEIRDEEGNLVKKELRSTLSPNEIVSLANVAKTLETYAFGESHPQGGVHIQNAHFQVGDNTLVQRAEEIVTRNKEIIDAIPFDVIGA